MFRAPDSPMATSASGNDTPCSDPMGTPIVSRVLANSTAMPSARSVSPVSAAAVSSFHSARARWYRSRAAGPSASRCRLPPARSHQASGVLPWLATGNGGSSASTSTSASPSSASTPRATAPPGTS